MRKLSVILLSVLGLTSIISCNSFQSKSNQVSLQDSIFTLKIKTYPEANQLYIRSIELKNDSVLSKSLVKLTRFAFLKQDWSLFHQYRFEFIKSQKLHSFHKDFGRVAHYSAYYFNETSKKDSAYYYYYQAYKLYEKANDKKGMGQSIYNVAIIQKNLQDYEGSKQNSNRALTLYKEIDDDEELARVYNNLGLVHDNQGKFNESLMYHFRSLELRKEDTLKIIHSLNNIGLSYQKQEQYDNALGYFSKGILDLFGTQKSSLAPDLYTKLLDNFGYTSFLKRGVNGAALDSLSKAYSIRKQTEDLEGLIMSAIHLSEYHHAKKDLENAVMYANLVENYSIKAKSYTDYERASQTIFRLFDEATTTKKRNWLIRKTDSINMENERQKDILDKIRLKVDEKDERIENQGYTISQLKTLLIALGLLIIIGSSRFIVWRMKKKKLQKSFSQGFQHYLIKKYNLTKENIDFWEAWVLGLNQKELSEKLFLSEDAVKSRRKSLRNRIHKVQKVEGKFTQVIGTNLYNEEKELYRETLKK